MVSTPDLCFKMGAGGGADRQGKVSAPQGLPVKEVERHAHRSLFSRLNGHKHVLAHKTKATPAWHPGGTVTISVTNIYAVSLPGNPYHPHTYLQLITWLALSYSVGPAQITDTPRSPPLTTLSDQGLLVFFHLMHSYVCSTWHKAQ